MNEIKVVSLKNKTFSKTVLNSPRTQEVVLKEESSLEILSEIKTYKNRISIDLKKLKLISEFDLRKEIENAYFDQ